MLFAVPRADRPQRTSFAAVAKLAGALDFGREVDCPECAAIVKLRPGSTVEVGGDDGVEREPIVFVPGPRQRHQTSPCRKTR